MFIIAKAVTLALIHTLIFFIPYSLGGMQEAKGYFTVIHIACFFIFSIIFFKELFRAERFVHWVTILTMFGVLSLSTVFAATLAYGFYNFYDTELKYQIERKRVESINQRRDRRGLPHEFFDKGKVDEEYGLRGHLVMARNGLILNAVAVLLLLYPLGLLYRNVTPRRKQE